MFMLIGLDEEPYRYTDDDDFVNPTSCPGIIVFTTRELAARYIYTCELVGYAIERAKPTLTLRDGGYWLCNTPDFTASWKQPVLRPI